MNQTSAPQPLYKVGDIVVKTGIYICVPCGYMQEFTEGEAFVVCEACLAGTPDGPDGYQDPSDEFWEFVQ